MKRVLMVSLASAVVAVFCAAAFSQVPEPPPAVFGAGGGSSSDGTTYLSDTIGQTSVGISSELGTVLHAGFWYVPERLHSGPTSPVAISMTSPKPAASKAY